MLKALFVTILVFVTLAACGGSDAPVSSTPPDVATQCSADTQKQFVLDAMRDVYFWNDLLPQSVDIEQYASADDLLAYLISVQPLDDFSYIDSLASDSRFFEEGQYEGFGFSTAFVAANDVQLVAVFVDSPAARAGFARGQRITTLNGRSIDQIQASEGVDALFALPSLQFGIQRTDGSSFQVTLDKGTVTIDPVPQWRILPLTGGGSVGYLELASFIGTADAKLATAFSEFAAAGVADVIIDLRYNGGGRVDTTEYLGDLLGGVAHADAVFSQTRFNANNAISNRTARFSAPTNSINLSSLVVIATDRTASASELVTNSMFPYANVTIVGSTTRGKPVGQLGLQFCDRILRPTAFETLNANDEGGYFDGLTVDCAVGDDLTIAVGNDEDPNLQAALFVLENGACPPVPMTAESQRKADSPARIRHTAGSIAHRMTGAW